MENQEANLTRYVFRDGSETITDSKGKVIAVKAQDSEYVPWTDFFHYYVRGSTPNPDKMYSGKFSETPKENEHLVTSKILWFSPYTSKSPITTIERHFQLPACSGSFPRHEPAYGMSRP